MLHSKIIRDADKVDIFYILTFDEIKTIYETNCLEEEKITDEIYHEFIEERKIDYSKIKTAADSIIAHFAYVFDFYFDNSLGYVYENNYLEKLYNRVIFKDEKTSYRYNNAYKIAKQYVEERLNQ